MNAITLQQAVFHLAAVTYALDEAALERDYAWRYHDEGLRFALLGTYHELRDLAALTAHTRATAGSPITLAQRVLAQYHLAYRELQALLLGIGEEDAARAPAEQEWPLHTIVEHMIDTELGFFAVTSYGLNHCRGGAGGTPALLTREDGAAILGTDEAAYEAAMRGPFAGMLAYYDAFHTRVLSEFGSLSDDELQAPTLWWEQCAIEVRFRLHRFDAHLRQHTIQVEKTLDQIGHSPSEALRLLRLVYCALAEAEGAALGAPAAAAQWHEAATIIAARANEIAALP
jgi:hypothetical protein